MQSDIQYSYADPDTESDTVWTKETHRNYKLSLEVLATLPPSHTGSHGKTIRELSEAFGVPMAAIQRELSVLRANNFPIRSKGDKYYIPKSKFFHVKRACRRYYESIGGF